ncbi:Retrovirus-related Pol polyprotein from transposon 17.6, partial [Mucuna pruriens]
MHPQDESKTAFITDFGTFYYKAMPFGLKNASATYQSLMDRILKDVMGTNVEGYMDDMVVKSIMASEHCNALQRVFQIFEKTLTQAKPREMLFWGLSKKILGVVIDMRSP